MPLAPNVKNNPLKKQKKNKKQKQEELA